MNNTLSKFLIFAAGAVVGSAVTWKYIMSKYEVVEENYETEIEEAVEEVEPVVEENTEEPEPIAKPKDKPDIFEYARKLQDMEYTNYSNVENDKEGATTNVIKHKEIKEPYVISPAEFGSLDDYDTISLNYYADGVLADDMDEVIDDVDGTVGYDALTRFGEYEDDSVFVRNEDLKVDYEILLDLRMYSDIVE